MSSTTRPSVPPPLHEVLVIDDDALVVQILERWLQKKRGVKVRVAYDGPTAIAIASTHPISCVFSDVELVGESGVDLVRLLQLTNPGLPLCLMSAHMSEDQALGALANRVSGFLQKPLAVASVLEQFDSMLATLTQQAG